MLDWWCEQWISSSGKGFKSLKEMVKDSIFDSYIEKWLTLT
jgi:hypothetical protein